MVTILVAAILLVVAVPSFLSSIHGQQVVSVMETFEQDVAWARGQAISGAVSPMLTLNTNCSWTVSTGSPADSNHSMTPAQLAHDAPGITCSGIPATGYLQLQFDPMGMVQTNSNTYNTVTFTPASGLSSSVMIFGSGVLLGNPKNAS